MAQVVRAFNRYTVIEGRPAPKVDELMPYYRDLSMNSCRSAKVERLATGDYGTGAWCFDSPWHSPISAGSW